MSGVSSKRCQVSGVRFQVSDGLLPKSFLYVDRLSMNGKVQYFQYRLFALSLSKGKRVI